MLASALFRRYTPGMQGYRLVVLVLWLFRLTSAQTVPSGWIIVVDSKGACQIAVPPEWALLTKGSGAAILHDPTTAIAVVTSQPGQVYKPLSESLQRVLGIHKDIMFENNGKRSFYQDKISKNSLDPSAYSVSVPSKTGTCSCHVSFLPIVPEDTAKKIALSLGPVPDADRQPIPTGND